MPSPAAPPDAMVPSPPRPLGREELDRWGERFGEALTPPAVITLSGDLGAGKTTLVQAICRGYGVTEPVTSPTFALVHVYQSPRGAVHHLDLYRLRDERELLQIGWDEIVGGEGLVLIEWPERAGEDGAVPDGAVHLQLAHVPGDPGRRLLGGR